MKKCWCCGQVVSDGAKYCQNCGIKLSYSDDAEDADARQESDSGNSDVQRESDSGNAAQKKLPDRERSDKEKRQEEKKPEEGNALPSGEDSWKQRLLQIAGCQWARVFCIAYTGKLVYQLAEFLAPAVLGGETWSGIWETLTSVGMDGFAMFAMAFNLLVAIFGTFPCIGGWLVYSRSKKNVLSTLGFSVINIYTGIIMALCVCAAVIGGPFGAYMAINSLPESQGLLAAAVIIVTAFLFGKYWIDLHQTTYSALHVAKGKQISLNSLSWPIIVQTVILVLELLSLILDLAVTFGVLFAWGDELTQVVYGLSTALMNLFSQFGITVNGSFVSNSAVVNLFSAVSGGYLFSILNDVLEMVLELLIQLSALAILRRIRRMVKQSL